jgi:pilus assembly protein CpaE
VPEAIRSVIIENDPETTRMINLLGRRSGSLDVRWTAGSMEEAAFIIRKFTPDMAIVEVNGNPASVVGPLAREFPNLYILALSATREPEYALETMRAGAHDLLCKPVVEVDLSIAIEKARKARLRMEPAERRGKIVTVFSNKGGNGTTTIAANLSDALATDHGKRVVVVDLVMGQGDVTMFFNVNPTYTVLDLARNSGKADLEYIDSLIVRHASGVCILADPPRIEDTDKISAEQVRDMLATLRSTFDVVIVDTTHQFDEKTLAALEMSDTVLLVTLLNLPSLKNTQRSIELFARLGIFDDRVQLVLSRYLPNDEIPKESIEGILNCPVFYAIPNDYPTVLSSINRGKLLSEVAPEKEVTDAFRKMAELLVGPATPRETRKPKRGFLEKIFRLERSAS